MGFFYRFKKKEEKPQPVQEQPLRVTYADGMVAEVNFAGLQDDEGKIVHRANITYFQKDGGFTSKSVLLEPIPYQDENGNWVDGTELYYRQLAELEDQQAQEAMHLFFDKHEIETLEKWSSNYLGNLVRRENGHYGVNYDENYRVRHSKQFQDERAQKAHEEKERHERREAEIAADIESKKQQGLQQQLQDKIYSPEEDTSGYAGRLTQEDYQRYFGNRQTKTPDVR